MATQTTQPKVLGLHPTIPASIAALLIVIPLSFVPEPFRTRLVGYQLFIIAGVYIGFAVNDGRRQELLTEIAHLLFFFVLTVLGLWVSPWFLVGGYILHGVWDLLHRPEGIQTKLARWYPPLCLAYDWVFAAFLTAWIIL